MATWKDAFPGNYLKADDLRGHRVPVTIASTGIETMVRVRGASNP